jgi:hypothetical protein
MPYDHYLFDVPDMGEVLDSIAEDGEDIIGTFYITDSQQVCIVVRTNKIELNSKSIERLFKREEA